MVCAENYRLFTMAGVQTVSEEAETDEAAEIGKGQSGEAPVL